MLKHTLFVPHEEVQHQLLCFHTSLPAHRLAYQLNKTLNIKLKRDRKDLDARNESEQYPVFSYRCPKEKINWRLISNKVRTTSDVNQVGSLFESSDSVRFLFNSLGSVDFLLDSDIPNHRVEENLQKDPMIQSCYPLPKHLSYIKQQLSF